MRQATFRGKTSLWTVAESKCNKKGTEPKAFHKAIDSALFCEGSTEIEKQDRCAAKKEDEKLSFSAPFLEEDHAGDQEPLSIPALAALCDRKESYFQRLFKEVYGMSPTAFAEKYRSSK